jgi:hypothetical protein
MKKKKKRRRNRRQGQAGEAVRIEVGSDEDTDDSSGPHSASIESWRSAFSIKKHTM